MTDYEIGRLVYAVRGTYPKYYANMGAEDLKGLSMAWALVLGEYDFAIASRAVQLYLTNDTTGFPPSPGQIVDAIHKITNPRIAEMTATEAWELAQLDIDQVETVEQSHFIKAYNTQVIRERETAKMPSDIRALVEKAVSEKRQLANQKTGEVKKITANGTA